ncbi:MAG: hypothetical protein HY871_04860 [Chloroflexi bacterium]|nr:hypothetical protein [Chloroflexota bacterium]
MFAGVAAWASVSLRRYREYQPGKLAARALGLAAKQGNGEITLSQVMGGLDIPAGLALETMAELERQGQCHLERRGEKEVYVFPGLVPSKVVRRCPYCGTQHPVKTAVYQFPNCGASLELKKE